jgi:hypothetical protein
MKSPLLERLRNKTDGEKQKLALGISVIVTSLIFLVWISTFSLRLGEKKVGNYTVSPFAQVKEGFSDLLSERPSFSTSAPEASTTTEASSTEPLD